MSFHYIDLKKINSMIVHFLLYIFFIYLNNYTWSIKTLNIVKIRKYWAHSYFYDASFQVCFYLPL